MPQSTEKNRIDACPTPQIALKLCYEPIDESYLGEGAKMLD